MYWPVRIIKLVSVVMVSVLVGAMCAVVVKRSRVLTGACFLRLLCGLYLFVLY